MAANLLAKGFPLTVHNRHRERERPLAAADRQGRVQVWRVPLQQRNLAEPFQGLAEPRRGQPERLSSQPLLFAHLSSNQQGELLIQSSSVASGQAQIQLRDASDRSRPLRLDTSGPIRLVPQGGAMVVPHLEGLILMGLPGQSQNRQMLPGNRDLSAFCPSGGRALLVHYRPDFTRSLELVEPGQPPRTLWQGREGVAASACATPIGAFDPLEAVAEVCERHDFWLHVDAAHGGAVLFSRRHRGLLAGCERSHSLTWDAHKMLFVPALCAFLLYRDRGNGYRAFQQAAPYLFDPSGPDLRDYDGGLRTVECTKRGAALGLWGVWSLFGPGLFEDLVDVTFALGRSLYEKLQAADDFEALHEPECNIVVFRHIPARLRGATPAEVGAFQLRVRRRAIESGETYLVPGSFGGVPALRCTLMNPLTTPGDLDQLLETVRRHGQADAAA
jgi:hypothetical protein